MKDIFSNLKTNILCKRTRNKMLSSYLSNQYFGFDNNAHASSCIKCQVSGKRYKAFKEELDNEFKKEVEKEFKRKSKKEKLEIKYRNKLEEAYKMSTVNRSKSDELTYEAEQILKQIENEK